MKLSVVIPARNEEAVIAACIESVRPFADEILVADSGSTDGSPRLYPARYRNLSCMR